jgi:hypothetical protein
MEGTTLLQDNPKATKVIKDWFMAKMIKSFEKSMDIPDDLRETMLQEGIEDDKLSLLISENPRMLFDVLDDNDIHVAITIMSFTLNDPTLYSYIVFPRPKIHVEDDTLTWHPTRLIAESLAIEEAIQLLNNKL